MSCGSTGSEPRPHMQVLKASPTGPVLAESLEQGSNHRPVRPDRSATSSWAAAVEEMDAPDLRSLVLSLPVIEQAKGVLMGFYGCDSTVAFAVLRRWSSTRQVKIRDLAAALVDHVGGEQAHGSAEARERIGSLPTAGARPDVRGLRTFLEAYGLA